MKKLAQKSGKNLTGTSIFDPVLCELLIQWFCPAGGHVLDPFAGGSVRGMVAALLGRAYIGIDLSASQVTANKALAVQFREKKDLSGNPFMMPGWFCQDSRNLDRLQLPDCDFLLSCPPYTDLEVYSDDPADLSTLDYPSFRDAHAEIISKAVARLKQNSFAAYVIGEVRSRTGEYYGFIPDTIRAFEDAGMKFYNEAILVTCAATLSLRAAKPFEATRKLGKTHQNVLVFTKGDPAEAKRAMKEFDLSGEFAQQHQNVLVFTKGDPRKAVEKLPEITDPFAGLEEIANG